MSVWKVEERLETELPDLRDASVQIVGGDIVVAAGEGEPTLEVERQGGPPVDVVYADGVLRIRHGNPEGNGILGFFGRFWGGEDAFVSATVVLRCPASTRVQLGSVTASTVVAGLAEHTTVKTVSGDVTLKDIAGEARAGTVSGDIDAIGIAADLRLKTVSGSASLVDGSCSSVDGKSVSGDLVLDLDLDPHGVYSFTTVSGLVAVRTAGDPSVVVEASSVSGAVISDFDLGWSDDRPGRRRLRQTIGDGEARMVVKTVSGDLRLLRRRVAA